MHWNQAELSRLNQMPSHKHKRNKYLQFTYRQFKFKTISESWENRREKKEEEDPSNQNENNTTEITKLAMFEHGKWIGTHFCFKFNVGRLIHVV